jgi:hypothetical protein
MSVDVTVKIAFDLAAAGRGDFFTIGDSTKGTWGTASSPLAGDILTDVTEYVRAVNIRRGRSRELEQYQAGAATVVLDNRNRYFDPTAGTATSPYAPSIVPRKELVVEIESQREFTGQVEDWDIEFDVSGDSTAQAKASDAFALLANQTINDHLPTEQTTGERINAILSRTEIGWPQALRDIDTGEATVSAGSVTNTPTALAYIQQVSDAEPGAFFTARDGRLTFRDRNSLQTTSDVVFSDDGSGIPFMSIGVQLGSEALRNRVTITRLNGGTVVAEDLQSQEDYGIIDYQISNSLLSTDEAAEDLADWIVGIYSQPVLRVNSVAVNLDAISSTDLGKLLALELGQACQVLFTPGGVGDQINRFVAVDSIQFDLQPTQQVATIGFSEAPAAFLLDNLALGRLDFNALGW